VSATTAVTSSIKERTKSAVISAAERAKLKMTHRLSHKGEQEDLRSQVKAEAEEAGVSPVTLTRKPSLPWEAKLQEPGLKDVKLVGRKPRRLIVACDGTWTVSGMLDF